MSTEAKLKVAAATRACDEAHKAWGAAVRDLAVTFSVNGYGIFNDHRAFRRQMVAARTNLSDALAALDGIDWPTDTDYDEL